MSEPLQIEFRGRIGVITMCRGVTNAIHPNLISGLDAALDQIESVSDVRGIVLTGGEKFFSIGFDLPYLLTLPEPEFASFYRSFNQFCLKLFRFRLPVVAALGGHATAGGCILALCCDYRLIAEGRKLIGLNEVKLGLPVPFPADRMLHALIGTRHARQVLERGSFYEPPAALDLGLVDKLGGLQDAIDRAAEIAKLGDHPVIDELGKTGLLDQLLEDMGAAQSQSGLTGQLAGALNPLEAGENPFYRLWSVILLDPRFVGDGTGIRF